MKTMLTTATAILILLPAVTRGEDNLKAFPPAEEGSSRYVLNLPEQEDESGLKIELLVGQTHELDEINRYFFGGKIRTETIPGWGFSKYVVDELGPMAGTRVAVDPTAPRVKRFVSLGEPLLLPYNSRLPVVVYVPEEAEVRYRIWRADEKPSSIKKG